MGCSTFFSSSLLLSSLELSDTQVYEPYIRALLGTAGDAVPRRNRCSARLPAAGPAHGRGTPTPYTLHLTPYTLHPTPYTLHPTPYTLHLTPDTLVPTPYTLHPAPYTLNPTTYTLHLTPYTLNPTPYTLHPTPYTLHLTPDILNPTPYNLHPQHYTLHRRPSSDTSPPCNLAKETGEETGAQPRTPDYHACGRCTACRHPMQLTNHLCPWC